MFVTWEMFYNRHMHSVWPHPFGAFCGALSQPSTKNILFHQWSSQHSFLYNVTFTALWKDARDCLVEAVLYLQVHPLISHRMIGSGMWLEWNYQSVLYSMSQSMLSVLWCTLTHNAIAMADWGCKWDWSMRISDKASVWTWCVMSYPVCPQRPRE